MTLARRSIRTFALGLAVFAAGVSVEAGAPHSSSSVAHAQAAPTAEELEAAKKAYGEGAKLFAAEKYAEAAEKFKESYRLSRNPVLLYNIGLTFERLGTKDKALFYYKKFLKDAPAEASQRPDVEKSIKQLEKEGTTEAPDPGEDPVVEDPVVEDPVVEDPVVEEPVKPKRTGPFTAEDFEHNVVDEAPPGTPLDLTASVPEEAGWTVSLSYRGAGDDKFTVVVMKPRYKELVGRIPAAKMKGNAVQYFVEVKNEAGELITRIGKSTSPNVVYLDAAASPRYYPDLDEDAAAGGKTKRTNSLNPGDDEDPLGGKRRAVGPVPGSGGGDAAGGPGFMDVGSKKFSYAKWGATGVGAGFMTLSVTFYLMASSWGGSLEGEANASSNPDECADPPCRTFDDDLKAIQDTGKRYQTLSRITFGVGLAGAAVAGYFWFKELRSSKKSEASAQTSTPSGLRSLVASPVVGDDFLGGAAALRF